MELSKHQPTPEQVAAIQKIEAAIVNEVALAVEEQVPVSFVLIALGMTITKIIHQYEGEDKIAPWFEGVAAMIRSTRTQ